MPKFSKPPFETEPAALHPVLGVAMGEYDYSILGDAGGMTQFGVHIEVLKPGSHSSLHHWHETEDEMIYMLTGEVILVEDEESILYAGDFACWPAGAATGHHLENRSGQDASYLTIGTRHKRDVIHYPHHDLITHKNEEALRHTHHDGRPYEKRSSI